MEIIKLYLQGEYRLQSVYEWVYYLYANYPNEEFINSIAVAVVWFLFHVAVAMLVVIIIIVFSAAAVVAMCGGGGSLDAIVLLWIYYTLAP